MAVTHFHAVRTAPAGKWGTSIRLYKVYVPAGGGDLLPRIVHRSGEEVGYVQPLEQ